ncbi:MAG: hypothetical protein HY832_02315 [Candidatus Aenigmarchaeota archaeon]|nr:hypothetical protein [Candidatus Aenigmarchaeota archaeon]
MSFAEQQCDHGYQGESNTTYYLTNGVLGSQIILGCKPLIATDRCWMSRDERDLTVVPWQVTYEKEKLTPGSQNTAELQDYVDDIKASVLGKSEENNQ